jgi:phosphoribosyl-ATP pyrophosphohydrolase
MLQFQAGEYCICIWDGEQTKLGKAIESLSRYTEDEKAVREHDGFTVTVWTFDQGNTDDKAKKVLEEASEVLGALHYEGKEAKQTLYGIADTVTACLNLVRALGYTAEDFQKQLDLVDESNMRKGR